MTRPDAERDARRDLERANAEARVCFDAGVTFGFMGGVVYERGLDPEDIAKAEIVVPAAVLCDVYWKGWADKVTSSPLVAKFMAVAADARAENERLRALLLELKPHIEHEASSPMAGPWWRQIHERVAALAAPPAVPEPRLPQGVKP